MSSCNIKKKKKSKKCLSCTYQHRIALFLGIMPPPPRILLYSGGFHTLSHSLCVLGTLALVFFLFSPRRQDYLLQGFPGCGRCNPGSSQGGGRVTMACSQVNIWLQKARRGTAVSRHFPAQVSLSSDLLLLLPITKFSAIPSPFMDFSLHHWGRAKFPCGAPELITARWAARHVAASSRIDQNQWCSDQNKNKKCASVSMACALEN